MCARMQQVCVIMYNINVLFETNWMCVCLSLHLNYYYYYIYGIRRAALYCE